MKDRIIQASIESLRQEGLKFSLDVLSDKLKISKKTVYKYFPDKEELATALYEKYYSDVSEQAKELILKNTEQSHRELLLLYFDSKVMTRNEIFNKYKLNSAIYTYTAKKADSLWELISASFCGAVSEADRNALRIIVDGSLEKLCSDGSNLSAVIERLVSLLW